MMTPLRPMAEAHAARHVDETCPTLLDGLVRQFGDRLESPDWWALAEGLRELLGAESLFVVAKGGRERCELLASPSRDVTAAFIHLLQEVAYHLANGPLEPKVIRSAIEAWNLPDWDAFFPGSTVLLIPLGQNHILAGFLGAELDPSREKALPLALSWSRFAAWIVSLELALGRRATWFADTAGDTASSDWLSFFDTLSTGILFIAPDLKVRLANAKFGRLFALDPESLVGRDLGSGAAEILERLFRNPHELRDHLQTLRQDRLTSSCENFELAVRPPRMFERSTIPVHTRGGVFAGWLEEYREITAERTSAEKLLQADKLAALGHIVAGVAHELNNPLTAVTGYAQLLREWKTDRKTRVVLEKIDREAQRAVHIIQNLLSFTRERKPEWHYVDINAVLEQTLALRDYELQVENIRLEKNLSPKLPLILGDEHLLQQVLLNLLLNAEQALVAERRPGTISVRTALSGDGSALRVEIADNGPGIPPENMVRIFEPFFTTKEGAGGTGLGLSVSQQIVRRHDGRLRVASHPQRGTTFVLELPAHREEKKTSEGAREEAPAPTRARRHKPRLLVVDDEPNVAQMMAAVLEEEACRVDIVFNGAAALEKIEQADYDLVLCDVRMPGLNGETLYQYLREQKPSLASQIIFTTGDTVSAATRAFLEATGNPYLAKPFLISELKAAVEKLLAERV